MTSGVFKENIKFLAFIGLWEVEGRKGWRYYVPYMYIRAVTLLHLYEITVMWLLDIYYNIDQPLFICQDIVLMAISVIFITVALTFLWQPTRLQQLVASIEGTCEDSQLDDEYQRNLRNKSRKYLDLLAKGNLYFATVTGIWFHISATLGHLESRTPLTRGWYPFDVTKSPYLELAILQLSIAGVSFNVVMGVCTVFILATVIQTIVQFKILRYQLINMRKLSLEAVSQKYAEENDAARTNWEFVIQRIGLSNPRNDRNPGQLEESDVGQEAYMPSHEKRENELLDVEIEMEQRLKRCIQHHQTLISLKTEIEEAFNWLYFVHFACNLIPAGCVALYITKVPVMNDDGWGMLSVLVSSVLHLFIHCYVSDYLTSESFAVKEAAYDCSWFESTGAFKKSLRILMTRANEPCVITVASQIPLSLPTFKSITDTSYSAYMTLLTLTEVEK